MTRERSPVKGFFLGVWRVIDGARKVFLNLLFFGLVLLIISTMMSSGETLVVQPNSALVVQPVGRVVEEYTSTPFDQAIQKASEGRVMETRLRDIVTSIRRAANDARINVLVLDPSLMWGIGLASLQEVEAAVRDFRESGKPVIAFSDMVGQHQYYFAALADEVWLNPEGGVWLDGYSVFRQYYREALEKLSVEVRLFRAGEYKSGGEPYVRDDMSPEAREANLFWLGSLWQSYLEGVSRQRGVPLEDLSQAVEQFADRLEAVDGDFAVLARDMGLVDRLVTRSEAFQELAAISAHEHNEEGFRHVSVEDYLAATSLQGIAAPQQKVAVVVAQGEIVPGYAERGYIASEATVDRLRALAHRQDVSAVVVRIDSPGGDAASSEKIRAELQAMRDAGKTVVVSMGNVAASGGYWIAMAADEIWAAPSSITGSIGVYGLAPRIHNSLDRIGVHTDGVATTPLAGAFDPTLPMPPDLERVYRVTVDRTYEDFIEIVSEARGLPSEEVREVAGGRVWSGAQALERGLVDHVGTLQQSIDSAGRIAGLGTEFDIEYEESELSAIEMFLLEMAGGVVVRSGLFSDWTRSLTGQILVGFQQDLGFLARNSGRLAIASHCWCRVE